MKNKTTIQRDPLTFGWFKKEQDNIVSAAGEDAVQVENYLSKPVTFKAVIVGFIIYKLVS